MNRTEAIIYIMRAVSDAIDSRVPMFSRPDWFNEQHRQTEGGKHALRALGVTDAEMLDALKHAFPIDPADLADAIAGARALGIPESLIEEARKVTEGD